MQFEKKHIENILVEAGVPCAPVMSVKEIMNHPQIAAREMNVALENKGIGEYETAGIPIKFEKSPGEITKTAPDLGENTHEILKSLGYSKEAIDKLAQSKVI